MKNSKILKVISLLTIIMLVMSIISLPISNAAETADIKVDLTNLKYTANGTETEIKTYTQDDFETFLSDYNNGNLPEIYVTQFLFDGVSMVKTYDLDDFVESGNDVEVKILDITAININTIGNIEFSGEITGGMIAVDTNGRNGEINLILNGVNIDTDSKKVPAIYVYNKDITYTACKVTIKTAENSKNYVEGGKFKKVSLVGSDELSSYTSKYSGESQTNYTTYTNYYGVYTSAQINNILFAKVQADNEDLADGDPYYFYKGAGAISSDIDLYFEGEGYLEVTSKNKEGIETKGNLTFSGGTGDYVINAEDDCLNTTTKSSAGQSVRNALTIDVNTLVAIVDGGEDADEGDAIDSNGTLVINGGTIIAIAHPGQDAGLDSESGTYINGGTILATGDMYDAISSESKQNFIVLSFQSTQTADSLITLLNSNDEVIMAYKTDRTYTNLIYSSAKLTEGTYTVYKNGDINGTEINGFYTDISSYSKGTQQGYSTAGGIGGMQRGMNGGMNGKMNGEMNAQMPSNGEMPDGQAPEDMNNSNENRPAMSNSENSNVSNQTMENPPEIQDGEDNNFGNMTPPSGQMPSEGNGNITTTQPTGENMVQPGSMSNSEASATNKEFEINGISNQFSGVADYSGTDESSNETENERTALSDLIKNQNIIITIAAVVVIVLIAIVLGVSNKKKE